MSSHSQPQKATTEEALQCVRKRKPVQFEINTDPKTGLHAFKGTYDPSRGLTQKV